MLIRKTFHSETGRRRQGRHLEICILQRRFSWNVIHSYYGIYFKRPRLTIRSETFNCRGLWTLIIGTTSPPPRNIPHYGKEELRIHHINLQESIKRSNRMSLLLLEDPPRPSTIQEVRLSFEYTYLHLCSCRCYYKVWRQRHRTTNCTSETWHVLLSRCLQRLSGSLKLRIAIDVKCNYRKYSCMVNDYWYRFLGWISFWDYSFNCFWPLSSVSLLKDSSLSYNQSIHQMDRESSAPELKRDMTHSSSKAEFRLVETRRVGIPGTYRYLAYSLRTPVSLIPLITIISLRSLKTSYEFQFWLCETECK